MAHDTAYFPSPEEFIPERWEKMDKATSERVDPRNYVFGFGRRLVCVLLVYDAMLMLVTGCVQPGLLRMRTFTSS